MGTARKKEAAKSDGRLEIDLALPREERILGLAGDAGAPTGS